MARTLPWILVAGKQHRIYRKIKRTKLEKTWSKETEEEFKEEEEKELQGSWERRTRRSDLPGQRVRAAFVKCFEKWIGRRHGCMNYYLTQLLTGCFNAYLQRIRKMESAMCRYCGRAIDNAEHTLMECEE